MARSTAATSASAPSRTDEHTTASMAGRGACLPEACRPASPRRWKVEGEGGARFLADAWRKGRANAAGRRHHQDHGRRARVRARRLRLFACARRSCRLRPPAPARAGRCAVRGHGRVAGVPPAQPLCAHGAHERAHDRGRPWASPRPAGLAAAWT
jgi:hypothetical protein